MDDEAWLKDYRREAEHYARPSVTVDLTIFSVWDTDLKVLLIQRKEPPFRGDWALPGGFVRVGDGFDDQGEDLAAAAHRELAEETGLPEHSTYLEQLGAFGQPGRDPRMRIISIAYFALVRATLAPRVVAGSDASDAQWFSVSECPALAFDHGQILARAVDHIRDSIHRTNLAFELVRETFTIAELRAVYEAVMGVPYDPGNFRRSFLRMEQDGILERCPGKRSTGTRPAAIYRFAQTR
jgi:8-oxo-dGTP diphosphatase